MVKEKKFDISGRKLFIGIPSYDGRMPISAAYELPRLAVSAMNHKFSIHLGHLSGCSIINKARNHLVDQFMSSDCTEMLFIDSDINFKLEDILRIMALGSDKDIVCGCYPRRSSDKMFVTDIYYNEHGGVELTEEGLLRIERSGTGFMFIKRHVIQKLMDDHPEWKYWVQDQNKHHYSIFDFKTTEFGYMGEDYNFCDRAREAGFKIYLDPEINLGHFGLTEFTGHFGEQVLKPMIEQTISHLKVANG